MFTTVFSWVVTCGQLIRFPRVSGTSDVLKHLYRWEGVSFGATGIAIVFAIAKKKGWVRKASSLEDGRKFESIYDLERNYLDRL